jgi:hypothetical protein
MKARFFSRKLVRPQDISSFKAYDKSHNPDFAAPPTMIIKRREKQKKEKESEIEIASKRGEVVAARGWLRKRERE